METFIVHPKNNEEENVIRAFLKALKIKFENTSNNAKETQYNSEFIATMDESIQNSKEGKITRVKLEELWK